MSFVRPNVGGSLRTTACRQTGPNGLPLVLRLSQGFEVLDRSGRAQRIPVFMLVNAAQVPRNAACFFLKQDVEIVWATLMEYFTSEAIGAVDVGPRRRL